ncbi:MAG: hypothetical protein Q9M40_11235 [Sulfurimonas sp.]|nr:hypothetical protein [Sulfurimonas sp.]
MQIGSLPLYLGGYFSLNYRYVNEENRYSIDNIAILGYGSYEKFSYMAELEYKEFYVQSEKMGTTKTEQDLRLHVERFYIQYNMDENYLFQVGKYNSPIGYWNLLPINVLRDTTSSPVTSSIIFPRYTTGIDVSYSSYSQNNFKVDIMLQKNSDLDANYNNYEVDEHYGFGLTFDKDNLSLKFNIGFFNLVQYNNANIRTSESLDDDSDDELEDDETMELMLPGRYYALISTQYDNDKFKIMGEIGTQRSSYFKATTSYAAYLQGLYRINERHIGILRVESYQEDVLDKSDDVAIIGYTYRPTYPVAIKTEYQFHSLANNDTFIFSFSMMF